MRRRRVVVAAVAGSSRLLLPLLLSSFKTSYSFFYSFSLSRSLPPFSFGSMTTRMKIRTEMHLARSSSRFASRGLTQTPPFALGHSLFLVQTLRSNATSSLNTLTLSIIMSPAKQSLSLFRIPSSSRSRSWDFRVLVGFSLCSSSFIRAFPPFP